MPLKKSSGQMYSWVDYVHSHLGGECPHRCSYCYVQRNRFGVSPRYKGELRPIYQEFKVEYGYGRTIFIEHMNDMFANEIDSYWIINILEHCRKYPSNTYVFQTKNPSRAFDFISHFPEKFVIGTTIESNRLYENITKAPEPVLRFMGLMLFKARKVLGGKNMEIFITLEPILDFDVDALIEWFRTLQPDFINIGADSKNCHLPEPSKEKILELMSKCGEHNIPIRKKVNLTRIIGG